MIWLEVAMCPVHFLFKVFIFSKASVIRVSEMPSVDCMGIGIDKGKGNRHQQYQDSIYTYLNLQ